MDNRWSKERSEGFVHDMCTTLEQCVAGAFIVEICCHPLVEAGINPHVERSNQQDTY
jgi:hypothetical protein